MILAWSWLFLTFVAFPSESEQWHFTTYLQAVEYPVVLREPHRTQDPYQFVLLRYPPVEAGPSTEGGENPPISFAAGPRFIKEQTLHRDKKNRIVVQPDWPTKYSKRTIPAILRRASANPKTFGPHYGFLEVSVHWGECLTCMVCCSQR